MADDTADLTHMFDALAGGEDQSWGKILSLVYRELHSLAHQALKHEATGHTLRTTALVHEAYLRLVRSERQRWRNRAHFYGAAAKAMRRILVDEARRRRAAKRDHGRCHLNLESAVGLADHRSGDSELFEDLELLDSALEKLKRMPKHERKCTIVELRFFVGLSNEQTAEALDISLATVARDWQFARAWLHRELTRGDSSGS